jgi:hypothetical protein
VVEYVDMRELSFVVVYYHWLGLAASLQLLTLERTDGFLLDLYQMAVRNGEAPCLMKLQQLHLQMPCPSLQSLIVFFSFVEVVGVVTYCLFFHGPYACHPNNNNNTMKITLLMTLKQYILITCAHLKYSPSRPAHFIEK